MIPLYVYNVVQYFIIIYFSEPLPRFERWIQTSSTDTKTGFSFTSTTWGAIALRWPVNQMAASPRSPVAGGWKTPRLLDLSTCILLDPVHQMNQKSWVLTRGRADPDLVDSSCGGDMLGGDAVGEDALHWDTLGIYGLWGMMCSMIYVIAFNILAIINNNKQDYNNLPFFAIAVPRLSRKESWNPSVCHSFCSQGFHLHALIRRFVMSCIAQTRNFIGDICLLLLGEGWKLSLINLAETQVETKHIYIYITIVYQ